jgi:hypothetical protein
VVALRRNRHHTQIYQFRYLHRESQLMTGEMVVLCNRCMYQSIDMGVQSHLSIAGQVHHRQHCRRHLLQELEVL